MTATAPPRLRPWWVPVAAIAPAMGLMMFDFSLVNVALPVLAQELDASISDLQWIVGGFSLAIATFLPVGGSLGDARGRHATVLTGMLVFVVGTLAAALSPSVGLLLAARGVQGFAMALMLPNALALVGVAVAPEHLGRAVGLYIGAASVALLFGPTVGGLLVENFGWQIVFLVNVPIGLLGAAGLWRLVPRDRGSPDRPVDPVTVGASGVALFTLMFALVEAGRTGWDRPLIGVLLLVSAGAWVTLVRHLRASDDPPLDLGLLRDRRFSGALAIAFLDLLAVNTTLFFLSIELQAVRGLRPSVAGLVLLAFTGATVVWSPLVGRLIDAVGSRWPLTVASAAVAVALLAMAVAADAAPVTAGLLAALFVAGIGLGTITAGESIVILSAVPPDRRSVASATLSVVRQTGAALGIALFGSVAEIVARSRVAAGVLALELPAAVQSEIVAAVAPSRTVALPAGLDPATTRVVEDVLRRGLATSVDVVLGIAALLMLLGAVTAWRLLRPGAG